MIIDYKHCTAKKHKRESIANKIVHGVGALIGVAGIIGLLFVVATN
jgi:predicted membrane channel-forming protein YqfA (hemolysin III family)